ncbi:MAG: esterase-like activity of phytase family protein [Gordonia sp. (in: high G+C Gram-positive bacteria)]
MRLRSWGALGVSLALVFPLGVGVAAAAPAPTVSTRYTDSASAPPIPTLAGITGIDRTGNGSYVLISGDAAPARFFTARIDYDAAIAHLGLPMPTGGGLVTGPGNTPILPGGAQFEGIRQVGAGYVVGGGGAHPFVRILGSDGTYVRDLALPKAWRPARGSGVVGGRGITGVAVGPGGAISVITAGALRQDPAGTARLSTFGGGEYVYRPDPGRSVADVIAVNTTDFLVLERSRGRNTRIFWTTTAAAQPVTGQAVLTGRERAMRKTRIFSTAPLPGLAAGTMSSLAWGNWLPDKPGRNYRARILLIATADAPPRFHAIEVRFPRRATAGSAPQGIAARAIATRGGQAD